jgi:type II secretory pathway component PulC
VWGVRPNSTAATLGFENGDLVTTVGDVELTDSSRRDAALDAMCRASEIRLTLFRHGPDGGLARLEYQYRIVADE